MNSNTRHPEVINAYEDHGAYGRYSASARCDFEQWPERWHVEMRLGDDVVHERHVTSRRHAEHLLDAWVSERVAPEPIAEVRA